MTTVNETIGRRTLEVAADVGTILEPIAHQIFRFAFIIPVFLLYSWFQAPTKAISVKHKYGKTARDLDRLRWRNRFWLLR